DDFRLTMERHKTARLSIVNHQSEIVNTYGSRGESAAVARAAGANAPSRSFCRHRISSSCAFSTCSGVLSCAQISATEWHSAPSGPTGTAYENDSASRGSGATATGAGCGTGVFAAGAGTACGIGSRSASESPATVHAATTA